MQFEEIVALFPDFLDDKLSQRQRQWVDEALQDSEELRIALASLVDLRQAKTQWVDEDIPNWHRTAFVARAKHKSTHWMNWLSLATSMAAIFLVVFRIQIVSNSDGYQVSFGEQIDKVTFRTQAYAYLDDWQAEQVAYLDHRLLEFENKQLQQNQQVMTATLDFNRDERRKDLNQLTSYFVQQRSRDLILTELQYKKLYESQTKDRQAIDTLYASIDK